MDHKLENHSLEWWRVSSVSLRIPDQYSQFIQNPFDSSLTMKSRNQKKQKAKHRYETQKKRGKINKHKKRGQKDSGKHSVQKSSKHKQQK